VQLLATAQNGEIDKRQKRHRWLRVPRVGPEISRSETERAREGCSLLPHVMAKVYSSVRAAYESALRMAQIATWWWRGMTARSFSAVVMASRAMTSRFFSSTLEKARSSSASTPALEYRDQFQAPNPFCASGVATSARNARSAE